MVRRRQERRSPRRADTGTVEPEIIEPDLTDSDLAAISAEHLRTIMESFESETIGPDVADSDLGAIFAEHRGRLAHKWTQYFPAYSEQFAPFRGGFPLPDGSTRPIRFLEIGVSHGGSLQLWRDYFGPTAVIFGIDVDPRCSTIEETGLNIRIGSQADPTFLRSVVDEMGSVDIVLDDGSHQASHLRSSFDVLFPALTDGGLYVVEDLQTAYWPQFDGGLRRPGTFVEVVKDIIDDMHDWYHEQPRRVIPDREGVSSVAIYDGITFLHKRAPVRPMHIRVGTTSF